MTSPEDFMAEHIEQDEEDFLYDGTDLDNAFLDGEALTLDHVHDAYWLIPKPAAVRFVARLWRRATGDGARDVEGGWTGA